MTDSIVSCIKYVLPNGDLDHYTITFLFDGNSPLSLSVVLNVADIQNPTDLTEVKTKACVLAKQLKSTYAYELNLITSTITTLNGPITL